MTQKQSNASYMKNFDFNLLFYDCPFMTIIIFSSHLACHYWAWQGPPEENELLQVTYTMQQHKYLSYTSML